MPTTTTGLRCVGRAAPSRRRSLAPCRHGLDLARRRHRACCWRSPGGGCRIARSPACLLPVTAPVLSGVGRAAARPSAPVSTAIARVGERIGGLALAAGRGTRIVTGTGGAESRKGAGGSCARPRTRSDARCSAGDRRPASRREQQPTGSTLRSRRGAGCCPSFLHSAQLTAAPSHVRRPACLRCWLGPQHAERTPSRPIWEVKQRRAPLVPACVSGWEYRVPKPDAFAALGSPSNLVMCIHRNARMLLAKRGHAPGSVINLFHLCPGGRVT